jgi:hypothetical protein
VDAFVLDSYCSRQEPLTGCCEHGNEPSDSITGGEFLDLLSVLLGVASEEHAVDWYISDIST